MSVFETRIGRRGFLGAIGGTAAAILTGQSAGAAPANPYAPFNIGLQSYSLRHFPLEEALARTQELGLRYWEGYPGHMPITSDLAALARYKGLLSSHGIRMLAYGVVDFTNNESDARKAFEFARAMGVPVLSAHPSPDSFPLLNRLVSEYGILIAIHNHGPDDRLYGTWSEVLAAIHGQNPRIGACDDTGHYLMAGDSPVTAAAKFGKRLYDIHLKAAQEDANHQKVWGDIGQPGSLLDVVGLFRVLQNLRYRRLIAVEYEIHEDDPIPNLRQQLAVLRNYCEAMRTVTVGLPKQ